MGIRTTEFTHWQSAAAAPKLTKYRSASPNIKQILAHITSEFPGTKNLGNYGLRPIRGGTAWSSHAFGAAQDVSFRGVPDWQGVKRDVIRFLVEHSAELGVQAVHDYSGPGLTGRPDRGFIWRCNRSDIDDAAIGWKQQRESPNGMGQAWADWIHFEVCEAAWHDDRTVADRISGSPSARGPAAPPFDPESGVWGRWPGVPDKPVLEVGRDEFEPTRYAQGVLNTTGAGLRIDGDYGPRTEQAVIAFQRPRGLDDDGRVGKLTWAKIDRVAAAPPEQPPAPPAEADEPEVSPTTFDPERGVFGLWPDRTDKPELRQDAVDTEDEREATRYLNGVVAAVGYVPDGGDRFGARTDVVVRQIQKSNRLLVDGVVGPVTWRVIDVYAEM